MVKNGKSVRPHQAGATIELGGEARSLRYSFNKLEMVEDEFGISVFSQGENGLESLFEDLSVRKMKALAWIGMLVENPETGEVDEAASPTRAQVGAWLDLGKIEPLTDALLLAFELAMPEADEQEQAESGKSAEKN